MSRRFEVRDIKLTTGCKNGDSVTFELGKAFQIKQYLDRSRGDFIDLALAIHAELEYTLTNFQVKIPEFKGDELMKLRDFWSQKLKKQSSLKKETQQLRRDVFASIHIRNKYAHGKLGFSNDKVFLVFDNEEGKEVCEPFSSDVLKTDRERMVQTLDDLRRLNAQLTRVRG